MKRKSEIIQKMEDKILKKKKLWILLIVVLFVCSLTSVLFNYKNIKRNIEIAKELLKLEVPIEKIMMATGLSEKEILTLKND